MQALSELRSFIVDNFLYGDDDGTLTNDISFLERGIIDSTGVLELVSFIEEKFGVTVEDDELTPENFDSLSRLSSYVSKKMNNGE
jgi:acyl carrier protein